MSGWIGVDFDGTLATHDPAHWSQGRLGDPIHLMVERVKGWLAQGLEVRIVTARASIKNKEHLPEEVARVKAWCIAHIGQELEVTCKKDFGMLELWDDRARQVRFNTGEAI